MKVFYKERSDEIKIKLKALEIEQDQIPAHRVRQKIQFKEGVELNMIIKLYDNKTGQIFKDEDLVQKGAMLEYEAVPISS
jgi:hypothetical protein